MHVVTVQRRGGEERVVLRRFVLEEWLAKEPDLATHEAAVLRLLEGTGLASPGLLAADHEGSEAGVPSVLMTMVPGQPVLDLADSEAWVRRLAEYLRQIHRLRPTAGDLPYSYRPYEREGLNVSVWSQCPDLWRRAIEVVRGPRPHSGEHLIHRDYHPANVLWQDGRISGVVDWVNACRGPTGVDIGHCRLNLALMHGVEVADRFLDECRGWADYDVYWDLVTLLDATPEDGPYAGWSALGLEISAETVRERADAYVTSLVARL